MTAITFDTHTFVKRLTTAGMSEQQAEALADAQKESIGQAMSSTLATKTDIDTSLAPVKDRLLVLEKELLVVKWMVGTIIAMNLAILVRLFIK